MKELPLPGVKNLLQHGRAGLPGGKTIEIFLVHDPDFHSLAATIILTPKLQSRFAVKLPSLRVANNFIRKIFLDTIGCNWAGFAEGADVELDSITSPSPSFKRR